MKKSKPRDIDKIFAAGKPIDDALEAAVRQALLQHKRAGNPVAEWRNGRLVWVAPEDIPVSEEKEHTRRRRARRK